MLAVARYFDLYMPRQLQTLKYALSYSFGSFAGMHEAYNIEANWLAELHELMTQNIFQEAAGIHIAGDVPLSSVSLAEFVLSFVNEAI